MRRIKIGEWEKKNKIKGGTSLKGNPAAILPTLMDLDRIPFQMLGTYQKAMFYANPDYLVIGIWYSSKQPCGISMMRERVAQYSKTFFGRDMIKLGCRVLKDEMPTPYTYSQYIYLVDATTFDLILRDVRLYEGYNDDD